MLGDLTTKVFCNALKYDKMPVEKLRTFFKFLLENKPDETDFSKTLSEKVTRAKIPEDTKKIFMTLQQEITLAAKEAFEEGYKKASEEAEKEKENVLKKAEMEKELIILQNARKMKAKNISDDIIAECTGLSLQKIQEL